METMLCWQVSNAVSSLGINSILISHSTQLLLSFFYPDRHEELVDSNQSAACRQERLLLKMGQYETQ